MNGEQLLNSIRHLENEISALDLEHCRWTDRRRDLLESAKRGIGLTGVVVQHATVSRTENIAIQLADMEPVERTVERINNIQQRINRKIDRLIDLKQHAMDVIEGIPSTTHRVLLINRYLNCLQWTTIADLMGYDPDYTRNGLRSEALEAFEVARSKLHTKSNIL